METARASARSKSPSLSKRSGQPGERLSLEVRLVDAAREGLGTVEIPGLSKRNDQPGERLECPDAVSGSSMVRARAPASSSIR